MAEKEINDNHNSYERSEYDYKTYLKKLLISSKNSTRLRV
jgi:hypothetical protein